MSSAFLDNSWGIKKEVVKQESSPLPLPTLILEHSKAETPHYKPVMHTDRDMFKSEKG